MYVQVNSEYNLDFISIQIEFTRKLLQEHYIFSKQIYLFKLTLLNNGKMRQQ